MGWPSFRSVDGRGFQLTLRELVDHERGSMCEAEGFEEAHHDRARTRGGGQHRRHCAAEQGGHQRRAEGAQASAEQAHWDEDRNCELRWERVRLG